MDDENKSVVRNTTKMKRAIYIIAKCWLIIAGMCVLLFCKPRETLTEHVVVIDTLIVMKGGSVAGLVPCDDTVFTERVVRDSTGRVVLKFINTGDGIIAKCTLRDTVLVIKKVRETKYIDKQTNSIPAWRWVLAGAGGAMLLCGLFWVAWKTGRLIFKLNTGI